MRESMFCSGCGTQIQSGLNFCNRCGIRVPRSDAETNSVAANLSQSMGYIGGFGMFGFIFVILILVKNGVDRNALVLISLLYFAALFGICFLVIRQISASSKKSPEKEIASNEPRPAYLRPVTTAQLPEPGDHPISITEHTTRTLDEVMIERK